MELPADLSLPILGLTGLDLIALAFYLASWIVMGLVVERTRHRPSVAVLMERYRREWMQQCITRDPRVFDAMIMASLRDGTAFYASASMIAIGGGFALIANPDRLSGLARDLEVGPVPDLHWELKILLVILVLTNAFLKFVWSNRIIGYCSVVMGAIPNDVGDPMAARRAEQAAELNISAARSLNRALRSVYFALGGLAWLLGALPLIIATLVTLLVVWRREFASNSRAVLVAPDWPKEV